MFGLEKRVQDGLIRVENIVDKKERGLRDLIEKNKEEINYIIKRNLDKLLDFIYKKYKFIN